MRRLFALLEKEIAHHGVVVATAMAFLVFVGGILLLGQAVAPRTMTVLEGHATFLRFFVPLFGLALGNRLVVCEYHGRTQLFLEALPTFRHEVVGLKYVIGLAVLGLTATTSLGAYVLVALAKGEPLTHAWFTIMLLRTAVFVWVLWSFLFAMGFLGRWRIPLYLASAILLLYVNTATDVELARFGVFALVNDTLVLERFELPVEPLFVSAAIAAGLMALAAVLSLINEGSVAESMAKTMTRREKAAVGIGMVIGIIALDVIDPKSEKEPFAFEAETVVHNEDPAVHVLYLEPDQRPAAEVLRARIAGDLSELRTLLNLEPDELPAVHIALRHTLDPDAHVPVELEEGDDGVLLRSAFTAEGHDTDGLRAEVIAEVLDRVSDGRATFEQNAWLRAGFAGWFVSRSSGISERTAVRALTLARERRPSFRGLSRYQRLSERFGDPLTDAWATSAVHALVGLVGEQAFAELVRPLIGQPPPFFAVTDARENPPLARLAEVAGENLAGENIAALDARWSADLGSLRADPRYARWRSVPRAAGFATIESAGEGALRQVRWGLTTPTQDASAMCALVHAPLGPFEQVVDPDALQREERPCVELEAAGTVMLGRYGPDDRAFLAVEMTHPSLSAPLRVYARRETIR